MKKRYIVPRTNCVERTTFVEQYVANRDILHVGVGGAVFDSELKKAFLEGDVSGWFHARISRSAKSITTLEIEEDNIEKFRRVIPGRYVQGDITDPGIVSRFEERFDLVVFTEIIEHLDCFRAALQNIRKLLTPDGQVLISTVNAFNAFLFAKMIFRYETNHIEHTAYFSYLTLKRLLAMNELELREFHFTHDASSSPIKRLSKKTLGILFPQLSQGLIVIAGATGARNGTPL